MMPSQWTCLILGPTTSLTSTIVAIKNPPSLFSPNPASIELLSFRGASIYVKARFLPFNASDIFFMVSSETSCPIFALETFRPTAGGRFLPLCALDCFSFHSGRLETSLPISDIFFRNSGSGWPS